MISLTIGFILDFIIGDPENKYHPVRIIGKMCTSLEKIFRRILKNNLKLAGAIVWLISFIVTFLITYFIVKICNKASIYFGIIVESILIYFCISSKGLIVEGSKVIKHLVQNDIEEARHALSFIVGRDTANLDKESIIRAVIETIAENMSDGVIAPLLYAGIFGAPLSMAYKAVNTMDSMFGYKNDKYKEFGYYPAKLDDLFNYIPARITGILIIIASFVLKYDYKNSFKIYRRDRYNHSSPNSAHPESAMAGALNLMLGGSNYYFGKLFKKPNIGDDLKNIEICDVKRCNKILYVTSILGFFIALLLRTIIK